MNSAGRVSLAALLCACLGGCLQPGKPVVADRSPVFTPPPRVSEGAGSVRVYSVRKGDTLYSIAWRFELDYQGLARANALAPPYVIRPGQRLRLTTQLPVSRRVRAAPPVPAPAQTPPAAPPRRVDPSRWVWPLPQQPAVEFGRHSKGMDFDLGSGASARVRAANSGEVVYAGTGIGGFERLIIVKHGADLLSAYSFDGRALVNEQQTVKAGDELADIKNRGRAKQSLHFELRREGEPINPRSVLR